MVVVSTKNGLLSNITKGRMGKPWGCGVMMLGWNEIGDSDERKGTYQMQHTKKGLETIRHSSNWPENSKLPNQIIQQDKFKAGVAAWWALSPAEREVYNQLKKPDGLGGQQIFLRSFLRAS